MLRSAGRRWLTSIPVTRVAEGGAEKAAAEGLSAVAMPSVAAGEVLPMLASDAAVPLGITPPCVAQLVRKQRPLRVEVEGGGCSGFMYKFEVMDTDEEAEDDDLIYTRDGAQVVVDPVSAKYLGNAVIDFEQTMIRQGFRIQENPNSVAGCGCGRSFTPSE